MSAGETISNAKAANAEIDTGLRALVAATESQDAFTASAHEVKLITGQMKTPLDYAMGHLATAASLARNIQGDSERIKALLDQLPPSEVYAIATPNEMASGLAARILYQVESVHASLSFHDDTIAELRAALKEFEHPPEVKKTWTSLHYAFMRIKQVIKKL